MNDPRKREPSFHDLIEDHRLDSDPPFTRGFDRHVGRLIRLGVRWIVYTKGGTAATILITGFLTWLSHHLTHWMGP